MKSVHADSSREHHGKQTVVSLEGLLCARFICAGLLTLHNLAKLPFLAAHLTDKTIEAQEF